jgi:hypothetical protein
MFGRNYYFGLTRKFVTIFGTLFNDITIDRTYNDEGAKTKSIKVPIAYGSLDKLLARVNSDPTLGRKVAAVVPAMSFLAGSPKYDAERAIQATQLRRFENKSQFVGVPYNIDFQLFIYADQEEDGLRILENILPYFAPALTVVSKLVPEMGYELNIPIVLNSVDFQNDSWGEMEDRRKLIWTLNFTMKVQFTGPIAGGQTEGGIIKRVNVNLYDQSYGNTEFDTVRVQPGLTANGDPTTNLTDTIPYTDIEANTDFGYIVSILGPNDER